MKLKRNLTKIKLKKIKDKKFEKQTGVPLTTRIKNLEECGWQYIGDEKVSTSKLINCDEKPTAPKAVVP